jgi:hypothetical protein
LRNDILLDLILCNAPLIKVILPDVTTGCHSA